MSARSYWQTLLRLCQQLCSFYGRHRTHLPSDLPAPVTAALDALCAAVNLLVVYDQTHQGGRL